MRVWKERKHIERVGIINTYDQHIMAGGDRVVICYVADGVWRTPNYHVIHFVNGQARTPKNEAGVFYVDRPLRKGKPIALAAAIAWCDARYGKREYVRNRRGDYVEREVDERYPIQRN